MNELAPPQVIARLGAYLARSDFAIDHNRELLYKTIDHPAAPPETLRALHAKGIPNFNPSDMTEQPNWPADVLISAALSYAINLIEDEDRPIFGTIAATAKHVTADPASAADVLAAMLASRIYHLQRFAAASRFTPPEALAACVSNPHDTNSYILDSIARNPATPIEVLQQFYESDDKRIHEMLKNPELPDAVLEWIRRDHGKYGFKARIMLEIRRGRANS